MQAEVVSFDDFGGSGHDAYALQAEEAACVKCENAHSPELTWQ